jgi:hypothetical protein
MEPTQPLEVTPEPSPKPQRPTAITALCGLLIAWMASSWFVVWSSQSAVTKAEWLSGYLILFHSAVVWAVVSLWSMQRRGAWILLGALLANRLVARLIDEGNFAVLVITVLLARVPFFFWRRLR